MVGLTSAPPPKPKSNSSEPFYFRTSDRAPPIVAEILEGKGWKNLNVIDPNEDGPLVWNLLWKTGRFRPSDYKYCDPCQRLNHFPKAGIISRKDTLIRNLRKMKNIYGSAYDFFPQSFILPNEYTKFVNTFAEDVRHTYCYAFLPILSNSFTFVISVFPPFFIPLISFLAFGSD